MLSYASGHSCSSSATNHCGCAVRPASLRSSVPTGPSSQRQIRRITAVHQATRFSLTEDPSGVDGSVSGGLRSIPRILNLMRAHDQQGANLWSDPFGARKQAIDGRCQAQKPPKGTECDRPDCGALGRRFEGTKRLIGGASIEYNCGNCSRGVRECRGAGSPAGSFSQSTPRQIESVDEIASRDRPTPGSLQLCQGEPTPPTGNDNGSLPENIHDLTIFADVRFVIAVDSVCGVNPELLSVQPGLGMGTD